MSQSLDQESNLEIGLDYAHQDNYDEAVKFLTLAINEGLVLEDEEEARGWRSICYGQSGHLEEALEDADWLIARGYESKYRWRAHLKERLQDYEGAIQDYTHDIEQSKEHASWQDYMKRGLSYYFAKQFQNAIEDFTRALQLVQYPTLRDELYGWRGKACVELGNYQAGLDDFQRSLEISGDGVHVTGWFFYRGLAREKLGDRDGAIADYRRAIIDPEHQEAPRVLELIE